MARMHLIDGERDDAEHEMAFDLECAADAEKSGAELVFQTGVDAFGMSGIAGLVVEGGPLMRFRRSLRGPIRPWLGRPRGRNGRARSVAHRSALAVDRGRFVARP